MNKRDIISLLELSIEIELGVGALYELFAELYPEDREFWSQLHLEERSHATLLRVALDSFSKRGMLPTNLLSTSLEGLRTTIQELESLVDRCKAHPPQRNEAFLLAIRLENESGEKHYDIFMGKTPESTLEEVFQQLNRQDKDHKQRIESYFNELPPSAHALPVA